MLLYRVFPYLPTALSHEPGHPSYIHKPQGAHRLDNPGHYTVSYFALEPSGAAGETFRDLDEWSDAMFVFPSLPGSRRALATYRVDDATPLLDLDDA